MERTVQLWGRITQEPEYCPPYTEFVLEAGDLCYRILRRDPGWQKKDVVFLRKGFLAQVTGRPLPGRAGTVLADRIVLTEYVLEKEEKM